MTIQVLRDPRQAARAAATHIAERIGEAVSARGRCSLALAGGSTPRDAYRMLAGEALPWDRVHFFWTDERMVPPAHPDSNFRMVREALLAPANIPASNTHRIQGELRPAGAADAYARELADFFGAGIPRFDVVVLGLGADSHTASLFPWDPLVWERTRSVGVSQPRLTRGSRISLTLPVLNGAAEVIWLVTGSGKAPAVRRVIRGPLDPVRVPAQAVACDRATWFLDESAAVLLRD